MKGGLISYIYFLVDRDPKEKKRGTDFQKNDSKKAEKSIVNRFYVTAGRPTTCLTLE